IFQEFLDKLPKVTLSEGEAVRTYYVLEGDLLVTAQQVRAFVYAQKFGSQTATQQPSGELLVMTEGGKPVFWPKGKRHLTSSFARQTFPSQDAYNAIVRNTAEAADAWIQACADCGLSFQHLVELDGDRPTPQQVSFVVI